MIIKHHLNNLNKATNGLIFNIEPNDKKEYNRKNLPKFRHIHNDKTFYKWLFIQFNGPNSSRILIVNPILISI